LRLKLILHTRSGGCYVVAGFAHRRQKLRNFGHMKLRQMAKLTKRAVDELTSAGKPTFLWGESLAGFGVKALPSSAKKCVVKYHASGGGRAVALRWILLGAHRQLTCDQARQMAQQLLAAVAYGKAPQADKFGRRAAATFDDV
jgi:hypothetical protein